ncbi:MAG: hypothetical protein AMJ95_08455 [Omnitrophica WOR_2 bacterium SM23_72]|nr:MAG: hypothetical protein AMJ95_08455 [Omnitrophica WOR_2 bacterium SM23_72]
MGVVYKLNQKIKDFIIEQKKATPVLSCRSLAMLVEGKFQIKVSKSSINSIIKESGLSLPVGRRLRKRRRKKRLQAHKVVKTPPLPVPIQELLVIPNELRAPMIDKVPEKVEPEKIPQPQAPVEAEPQLEVKKAEEPLEAVCSGAIFLKAADYLLGGSQGIAEEIRAHLNGQAEDIIVNVQLLIYLRLIGLRKGPEDKLDEFWPLVGKKISKQTLDSYLNELQSVESIATDIFQVISSAIEEVRCVKVIYPDETALYLDGQLHTVWSTAHIPYNFSSSIYNITGYINDYLYKDNPFVLFMAPGYDTPTREFFNFIVNLDSYEHFNTKMAFFNNKLGEIKLSTFWKAKRKTFIFGLWPWQFMEYRKVKSFGEYNPLYFEPFKKELYVAKIEMELMQPETKKIVTFRGASIKASLEEKSRLVILSNIHDNSVAISDIATIYIKKWPNLEEAFQNFSRKIEIFTYTANIQKYFSAEARKMDIKAESHVPLLFESYLRLLDLYVKWHFLPSGYEDSDFSFINEHFYSIKATITSSKEYCLAAFQPPSGYPYLKDLIYACRRVNEKEVKDFDGRRIWLSVTA